MAFHEIVPSNSIKFGDNFELDQGAYELRRAGQPLKLGRIPMELLLLLVERRPQLVPRDEIVEEVWGKNVFLDTDNSINAAIRKLRQTLDDDPDQPRYIQTVIGRGYRFIAAVEDPFFPGQPASSTGVQSTQTLVNEHASRFSIHRLSVAVGASVLIAVTFLLSMNADELRKHFFANSSTAGSPGRSRPSVAVLGFKNLSGREEEAWVSTALSELLSADLAAGERLRLIPGENIARMKVDLVLPSADSYSADTLARIRKRLGSDMVVLGSYLAVRGTAQERIRVNLSVQDARTGDTIAVTSEDGTEYELAQLVSRSGDTVRRTLRIGSISPDGAAQASTALPENPTAARFYAEGLARLHSFDPLAARDLFRQVLAIDPEHAMSHAALSECWSNLGYDREAQEEAKKAFQLSSRLMRADQLSVEAQYRVTAHEWTRAVEIYRTLREFYPDNLEYGLDLVRVQTLAGLAKDAKSSIETLSQSKFSPRDARDPRIDLAAAKAAEQTGDFELERQFATAAAKKGQAESAGLVVAQARLLEAVSFERTGELSKATESAKEAQEAFTSAGDLQNAAKSILLSGAALYDRGDYDAARAKFEQSLRLFQQVGAKRSTARALNSLGNVFYEQGKLNEAENDYRQALAIDREFNDKGAIAGQLGNIANVLDSLGRLDESRAMQDQALAAFTEAGDKRGIGSTLNNIGNLLDELGNLPEAVQYFERALKLHQETGHKHGSGYALSGWGLVLLEQDRLADARAKLQEAMAVRKDLAEDSTLAQSWLSFAQLLLEENRAAEAEKLARDAAAQFAKDKSVENETSAYATLARALLAQQKLLEARDASSQATALSRNTSCLCARFESALVTAVVEGATGNTLEARRQLDRMITDARNRHFVGFELNARLERGLLDIKKDKSAANKKSLESLKKDAITRGYFLIARKISNYLRA
jgi:eukaryotic-like serine/threonine-protein kinase